MRETADVIIVGGGVIGVSIAYHLAQQQAGRIVLLERETLGSGSTGRSVATIDGLTLRSHAVGLFAYSTKFFQQCDEVLGAPCGFTQTGSIILAGPQQKVELATAVAHMQAAGVQAELLNPHDLAVLEPRMNRHGVAAASFSPDAGYADPVLTTQAFAVAARRLGVIIQQGRTVTNLLRDGKRIVGVETAVGPIHAAIVILVAGPWSADLLHTAEIDLLLQPIRHPVVCLRRPHNFGLPHHGLLDLTSSIYARPETGDLTLLGSIEPTVGHDPVNVKDGTGYVQDDYILWVMERLCRRYPALETSELRNGWAGFMTITPDWQPVIGNCADAPGLFCAAGFSGQGFQICPAVGHFLARAIMGDVAAVNILAPFAPDRFADGHASRANVGLIGHMGINEVRNHENR